MSRADTLNYLKLLGDIGDCITVASNEFSRIKAEECKTINELHDCHTLYRECINNYKICHDKLNNIHPPKELTSLHKELLASVYLLIEGANLSGVSTVINTNGSTLNAGNIDKELYIKGIEKQKQAIIETFLVIEKIVALCKNLGY